MKLLIATRTVLVLLSVSLLNSCLKDSTTETYSYFKPLYETRENVKSNIRSSAASAIRNPGKMVVFGHFLFVNEADEGVHIFDISNFSNPTNVAFVHIPGCRDMAVRDHYLYADCYTDLVSVDIANPANVSLADYQANVFPSRGYGQFQPDSNLVIVGWEKVDTVIRRDYESVDEPVFFDRGISVSSFFSAVAPQSSKSVNGTGSSRARFTLYGDKMYTVSSSELHVFNTAQPAHPVFQNSFYLPSSAVETIFPFNNYLFLGSRNGVFIYSLDTPDEPAFVSQFTHATACDPVITDGQYAYVTLRSGNACGGQSDQLDVLDVSIISDPQLLTTKPMRGPTGLSLDGNTLLVCDGEDGVKLIDAGNPQTVNTISKLAIRDAYDVMAADHKAIVTAEDGIYFIDYTSPQSPAILSRLGINK